MKLVNMHGEKIKDKTGQKLFSRHILYYKISKGFDKRNGYTVVFQPGLNGSLDRDSASYTVRITN